MTEVSTYLKNNTLYPIQLQSPVSPDIGMIIVIPSYHEDRLIFTLQSLINCHRPEKQVDVIVVINSNEFDPDEVIANNQNTYWQAEEWASRQEREHIKFHFLNLVNIPSALAGAGLARKIGMDEALARFAKANFSEGIIVSLNAGCEVSKNYLQEIESWFERNSGKEVASLYYEFSQINIENKQLFEAACHYELSCRYIKEGLAYAGFPFAFETHGFAFAIRANAYLQAGGMSKRKARASYYFLSKLTHLESYGSIHNLCVYPAARQTPGARAGSVPQISDWLKQKNTEWLVYHPDAFRDLKVFSGQVNNLYLLTSLNDYNRFITKLPPAIIAYLSESSFYEQWQEIKASASNENEFRKLFFKRFNMLWVEGFLVTSHDSFFEKLPLLEAFCKIHALKSVIIQGNKSLIDCLIMARNRQHQTFSVSQKAAS